MYLQEFKESLVQISHHSTSEQVYNLQQDLKFLKSDILNF